MNFNAITVPWAPVAVDGASSVVPGERFPNQTPVASILHEFVECRLIDKRAPD